MNQDPEYTPEQQVRFLQRIRELEQDLGWCVELVNGVYFVYDADGVLVCCDPDSLVIYGELLVRKDIRDHPKVQESRGNCAEELAEMARKYREEHP